MQNYLYDSFEEVEEDIKKVAPNLIYKYRGDWNNSFHKELITKQSLWFAAPKELNDPHDIRTPIQFDITEIEHPEFFKKLKESLLEMNPSIAFTQRDLNIISQNKLDEIRTNPKLYFENNYRAIREGDIYNRVGLFSCTTDELNETMWAHYGNNHTGFVVGFNTVELARNLFCSIGPVKYSNEIPFHSFINKNSDTDFDSYFLKSANWSYEKEFRFFTVEDDNIINRVKKYSSKSVVEFLVGAKFPEDKIEEFINEVRNIFPKEIPIYQVQPRVSGFGLEKQKIA